MMTTVTIPSYPCTEYLLSVNNSTDVYAESVQLNVFIKKTQDMERERRGCIVFCSFCIVNILAWYLEDQPNMSNSDLGQLLGHRMTE
jgi:hypothetical protein